MKIFDLIFNLIKNLKECIKQSKQEANDYTDSKVQTLDNLSLARRGVTSSSTHIDNIRTTGIWYITNADGLPQGVSANWMWSILIVINVGLIHQYLINPNATTTKFIMRVYSGDPARWGSWVTIK